MFNIIINIKNIIICIINIIIGIIINIINIILESGVAAISKALGSGFADKLNTLVSYFFFKYFLC